jgi:AcrR family transcriptional regulator
LTSRAAKPAKRSVTRGKLQSIPTKSERTRAAILNQALKFLEAHQFRDLSVSQLMAPLPVGRSAFYQYFADLHELMETLLRDLEQEIVEVANPWLGDEPDPPEALRRSLAELVRVCHARGPILRAVHDAAVTDRWLETAWNAFLARFDEAVSARIELDQRRGRIPELDASAVAMALNRMDAYSLIQAFGRRPRQAIEPVQDALTRIWIATLYPDATPGATGDAA